MIVKQILFFNKQPSTTLWFWVRAGKDRVSYWRRQPSFSATYILGSKTTFSWVGFFAFAGLKQSKSGRKGIWSCNFAKKSLANKVLNIAISTSEFRFSITSKVSPNRNGRPARPARPARQQYWIDFTKKRGGALVVLSV